MSWLKLRVFVFAFVVGVAAPVSVAPASAAPATSPATVDSMQLAAMQNEMGPPVMAEASQYEASAPMHAFKAPASVPIARGVTNPRVFREVFGFAYASSIGDPTVGYPSWNFSLLSTVAYFGLHVAWNGALVNDSGMTTWNDPSGPVPSLISTAHANGTKVVLTIIMQDSSAGTPNMCSALQYTSTTISQTVAQVVAKHADGVNVDYESNNTSCKIGSSGTTESSQTMFTGFIKSLRAALPSGSYLTVDTYSGSAGYRSGTTYYGFFDISSLASYVDAFFVMAYDMEYSNAYAAPLNCASFCIGPTAPLSTYLFNDGRASSEYRAVVPGSKVIMGIPYYGRKVCVSGHTPSNAPPNALASGSAAADGYLDASTENGYSANSDYHIHRDSVDSAGSTRWDTFTSSTANCTRELYFDDPTSLSNKYDLIIKDGLRGAGIWTLSYGGGAPELWSLLLHKFGQCSNGTIAADHATPQIPGTVVTFSATALCAGTPEFRFWTEPQGGPWTMTQAYSQTSTFAWDTTGKPLGNYIAEADSRNVGSRVDHDTAAQMMMTLARCVTPTLTPDHPSPALGGTRITFAATVTCQGTPEYRFWTQAPGGHWTIAQDYGSSPNFIWNTTGLALGDYRLEVDVRTQGTSVPYESYVQVTHSLTSCINTTLTTDKSSPEPTGTQVHLAAGATCSGQSLFRFWVRPPGAPWKILQDYSSSVGVDWSAQNPGGDYGFEVDAMSLNASPSSYVAANLEFTVTACSAAAISTSVASPQVTGASITLTGTATCTGTGEYEFLIRPPGGVWTAVQPFGSATAYTWNTASLATGVYGLEVEAKNVGSTAAYETAADVDYILTHDACTAPTLTPNVASPQATGATIDFTATSSTCPSPTYRFWVQPPGASWRLARDYSSVSTFAWKASGDPGAYRIEVDVRDASRTIVPYDAVAYSPFDLIGCSAATIATSPASPQAPYVHVTITGAATCSGTPEYRFWVRPPGGKWGIVRDYSSTSTYVWDTTSKPSGTYNLEVDVRDVGAVAVYETVANTTYDLTPPCAKPTLTANQSSPQAAGTAISFTGATSLCANPEYRFWLRPPGGSWAIVQDYSPSSIYAWSGGTVAGTWGVEVDVRSHGSSAVYDSVANLSFAITALPPCTGALMSGNPASPTGTGVAVTFTGAATGCSAAQYRFWEFDPGSRWSMVRDYSTANTYQWRGGGVPGTYRFEVDVRSLGSTAVYDVVYNTTYTISGCTGATISADQVSPQPAGTTIVFTGSATCLGTPQYRFWVSAPGGPWTIVQDYSPSATFSWTTSGKPRGTYRIEVDVRDVGASNVYETVANTTFALS